VSQIALQRNGDNFHIIVWMRAKTHASSDCIVVQNTQHSKLNALGIVPTGKTKPLVRIQPTMIGVASCIGFV
jgi:hypothetical protein